MKKAGLFLSVFCFQILIGQTELELVVADTSLSQITQSKEEKGAFHISGAEIKRLPIRGIENILSLDPEYVLQDGRAHLRGSRDDEIGYFLEGMNIRNPMTGQMYDLLIEESVERLEIRAGHIGVNYGNSVAGIVTQQMRSGGDRFSFDVNYRAEPAQAGDDLGGSYASGYSNTVLTAGGPLFSDNLRFFVAQEIHYQQDHNPRFYSPFQYLNVPDMTIYDPLPVTEDIVWGGELAPNNSRERYKTNLNLVYESGPLSISGSGAYLWKNQYHNFAPVTNVLNDRAGYTTDKNLLLNAKIKYRLSKKSLVTAGFGYVYYSDERFDETYGNGYGRWYNFDDNPQLKDYYDLRSYHAFSYSFYGFSFLMPDVPVFNRYEKHRNETYQANMDFQYKFNANNKLTVGADYTGYKIRSYSVYVNNDEFREGTAFMLDPEDFGRWNRVNNFGYDEYGNDLDDDFMGSRKPFYAGIYIKDEMEFDNIRLDIGLRYDIIYGDDDQFKNPGDPYSFYSGPAEEDFEKVPTHTSLSPRLALSFFLSEKLELFTRYGKYVQLSQGTDRYYGIYELRAKFYSGWYNREPAGLGLGLVESDNFELGFRGKPTDGVSTSLTLFYRNTTGQSGPENNFPEAWHEDDYYASLTNRVSGKVKGLVFDLNVNPTSGLLARLSYAYTDAEALTSEPYDGVAGLHVYNEFPKNLNPLDYSNEHRLTALFDYHFDPEAGPVLKGFGANLVYQYNSGHPYTLATGFYANVELYAVGIEEIANRGKTLLEPLNSSSISPYSNFDLRLDKTFDLYNKMEIKIYLDILNLFNTQNDLNVFTRSGNTKDDGLINDFSNPIYESAIARYGAEFDPFYRDVNIANGNAHYKALGKELWSTPRQIRFGIIFQY